MSGIVSALKNADDELASHLVSALVRMRRPEANMALIDAFALPNTRARKAIASGLRRHLQHRGGADVATRRRR